MSSKVLLIIPPESFIGHPLFETPLISAILSNNGYETKILEPNILFLNEYIKDNGNEIKKIINFDSNLLFYYYISKILDVEDNESYFRSELIKRFDLIEDYIYNETIRFNPKFVIFNFEYLNSSTKIIPYLFNVIKKIKDKGIKVIFSGSQLTLLDSESIKKCLDNGVDFFVKGEVEKVILKLLNSIENRETISNLDGIAFKKDDLFFISNKLDKLTEDELSSLPLPDYNKMRYKEYINNRIGTNIFRLIISRGCIGNCVFCSDRIIWKSFRISDIDRVVKQMKEIKERFNGDFIRFSDSILNADLNKLEKLCDKLIEEKVNIFWGGMFRIRDDMSDKLIKKMYDAGCRFMWIGVESYSQRILDIMKKGIKKEWIVPFISKMISYFDVIVLLISNFPLNTNQDTAETCKFLKNNLLISKGVHIEEFRVIHGNDTYQHPELFKIELLRKNPFELFVPHKKLFENYYSDDEILRKTLAEVNKNIKKKIYSIEQKYILGRW